MCGSRGPGRGHGLRSTFGVGGEVEEQGLGGRRGEAVASYTDNRALCSAQHITSTQLACIDIGTISVSVLPLAERAHQASTRNIPSLTPRFPLYRLFPLSLSIEPRHLAVFAHGSCIVLYLSSVPVLHFPLRTRGVCSIPLGFVEPRRDGANSPFSDIGLLLS